MSGLSQFQRFQRIKNIISPKVVEDNPEKLLIDFLEIASFIKMCHPDSLPHPKDDFFWDLFEQGETSILKAYKNKEWNGDMDPSWSLVISFIQNLAETANLFNQRWAKLPDYYFESILGVVPHGMIPDNVWISLENITDRSILLPQGTTYKVRRGDHLSLYQSLKDVEIGNGAIEKLYLLNDNSARAIPSISRYNVQEYLLLDNNVVEVKGIDIEVGVRVSSPILFLKEGRRTVKATLYFKKNDNKDLYSTSVKSKIEVSELFKLSISTASGWETIEYKTIDMDLISGEICFNFSLSESFNPVVACSKDIQGFDSECPVLNIIVNLDSSKYDIDLLANMLVRKVELSAIVENVADVQVYNELGKIDNSTPFLPFGITANKGSWFIIGNYESSIKNTTEITINLKWDKLLSDSENLQEHYKDYHRGIDNTSFKVDIKYLLDFEWKSPEGKRTFNLFENNALTKQLSQVSRIGNVNIDKMIATNVKEEKYVYSMQSREGFIQITLDQPKIGFGDETYRKLFTEQLLKSSGKKRNPTIPPPVQPILNRITIDYKSRDSIAYGLSNNDRHSFFAPIVPLDNFSNQNKIDNSDLVLLPNLKGRNILFALKNINAGEYVSLFFDLSPFETENLESKSIYEQRDFLGNVSLYLGNPLCWRRAAPGLISRDETMGLLINGALILHFPEHIEPELYDHDGLLWVRINYDSCDQIHFPEIRGVYANVVKLELVTPVDSQDEIILNANDGEIEEDAIVPGIGKVNRITPFYGGRNKETAEEVFLRISAYNRHRGRAVTRRDYEELILQRFVEIGSVKCITLPHATSDQFSLYLVIVPTNDTSNTKYPLASPYLIFEVENYMRQLISPYINNLRVINPLYEELIIKCRFTLRGYFSARNMKKLIQMINNSIAPWLATNTSPDFDHQFSLKRLHEDLVNEFGQLIAINDLIGIQLCKSYNDVFIKETIFLIGDQLISDGSITVSKPNAVLVPSNNHLINWGEDHLSTFGVKEMSIGGNFII
ncbi:hypothetical protein [Sphingobacterium paucimobilis]|uniref:Baseplate protein J-like domain-containing protein n=1 Tax=Sphingobacterium paucimobilis HER1398 TaxID=1346330 RepID=U2HDL8_9SPHI|nr:hypothetical protein [Sphingobacterium paucimobilis]ERJ59856.1 hypothetical protein M472_13880 [Sphingobacterium paucimobilis HER1398]